MNYEWCVMHTRYPEESHSGPMTEMEAREWVRETEEEDGVRRGIFYVAYRLCSPWVAA